MRERGRGRVGLFLLLLLLTVTLFLLSLWKRHRSWPRHRRWWRLRQQNQLWSKKSPNRNVGRSRVRPRHAAAGNRKPCEGNAHVPKYNRFRVSEYPTFSYFFFYFYFVIYSRFRYYCKFSVVTPHGPPQALPRTHCIFVRVALSVCHNSPYSSPYRNCLVITSSDDGRFFVSVHELVHSASRLNVSPLSTPLTTRGSRRSIQYVFFFKGLSGSESYAWPRFSTRHLRRPPDSDSTGQNVQFLQSIHPIPTRSASAVFHCSNSPQCSTQCKKYISRG
jgi:hypothetical protein